MENSPNSSLIDFAQQKLSAIEDRAQRRHLKTIARRSNGFCDHSSRPLISFSDNDYLGLSQDMRVIDASRAAAQDYGAGAGASRLITGNCPLNEALEARLADMKSTESALVFGSGYLANISLIPTLMRAGDVILMDALSHNCMFAGAKLSGATLELFRHNDLDHVESLLQRHQGKRLLVMTETVFSMDGDLAPLDALHALCEAYGAWLMSDDAHGLGILTGHNPSHIQMGTLSKAAGSYGGYICGPDALKQLLVNRGRGLIFTTALPPAVLGASLKALEIMQTEPQRRKKVLNISNIFAQGLGLPRAESAIVPVVIGQEQDALAASARLETQGFLVTAIRPPTVPKGTSRLRVSFSANHREEDVARLIQAFHAASKNERKKA